MTKFIKIDPPGTFCIKEALLDAQKARSAQSFLDVGCGGGGMSKVLCDAGLTGIGIDFSKSALAVARMALAREIENGCYRLINGDFHDLSVDLPKVDLAISFMVMEHVADDAGFIVKLASYVKPGGTVIVGVPGRRDRWSVEDDTVGHLRRYDRGDLDQVLRQAGLRDVAVWSIGVPVANILFRLSVGLIAKSGETAKQVHSQREQTETSGIREIPWKTVFPPWIGIILNRATLSPVFLIQRLFYRTGLGITMMGIARLKPYGG